KKEEKKPEPKPAPVKEKPKKEEPKKPEPKKDEPTLDDILKDLESDAPKTQEKPQDVAAEKHKNDIDSDVPYDPSMKLSQTVQDSIRNQIMECWNYQGGAKNQDSLVAYIQVTFKEDGSIIDAKLKASD